MKDEFYIGYYPDAPKGIARTVQITIGVILVAIIITVIVIVKSQIGFTNSQLEYGTLTELEGVLYRKPVPMLRVKTGKDARGKALYKSILLVNFSKFGAESLLSAYTQKGVSESESVVRLRGTLIYYDGVTVMELTEQENALLEVKKSNNPIRLRKEMGEVNLEGEIVDPKCYFGAMKPGENIPHRDCAIRCISGGIPPVFAVKNQKGETNYMLLTDESGNAINDKILQYVGIPVRLKGNLDQIEEWFIVKVNPTDIQEL
jgi:hypothetical protein